VRKSRHLKASGRVSERYLLCTQSAPNRLLALKTADPGWSRDCIVITGVGVYALSAGSVRKRGQVFGAQSWETVFQEVLFLAVRSAGGSGFRSSSGLAILDTGRDVECRQPRSIDSLGDSSGRRRFAVLAPSSRGYHCSSRSRRSQQAASLSLLDYSWRRGKRGGVAQCRGA
jgi:hypothetical protein